MKVDIQHKQAHGILSEARGFIDAFDYTLNPYTGCAFGCTYCYAAFFAPTEAHQAKWGEWVNVKANALELLRKKRKRPLIDKSIYMSSVTDPYQPVERQLELTRSLLDELLTHHQVRLVIQTRSPLVTRDIDLLTRFKHAQVNMTVTTDDDEVRKTFEPLCPSNQQRMDAVQALSEAGVNTCITMTPLLPVRDPAAFGQALLATGAQRFVIQDFHETRHRFVAGTGEKARALLKDRGWDEGHYQAVKQALATALPTLDEGKAGFRPLWADKVSTHIQTVD